MIPFQTPENAAAAIAEQKKLKSLVRLENGFSEIHTIAGIDVAYDMVSDVSYAAIVLMQLSDFAVLSTVKASVPTIFPYVPGLLSFREIPVVLKALDMLAEKPDLLMVDGQGVAHPRRLGIAAHLGVLTGMPAMGVAKSRLTGTYAEPGNIKGSSSPLMDRGETIGAVLRSKEKCKPLFISAGHKIDQQTALNLTLQCLTKYRLPEPTRLADKLSKVTPEEKSLFSLVS